MTNSTMPATSQSQSKPRPLYDLTRLLLIACWGPFTEAAYYLSAVHGHLWSPTQVHLVDYGRRAVALYTLMWLTKLVGSRTPRNAAIGWAAPAVGLGAIANTLPAVDGSWARLAFAAQLAAETWLALEVLNRHRLTPTRIGLLPPAVRRRGGKAKAVAITGMTILACYSASWITNPILQTRALNHLAWHAPSSHDVWGLTSAVAASLVTEDLIILAAAVVLLEAAKAPRWLVYFLPCALTVAGHAYLGLPAFGMALYAFGRVYFYRNYRRVIPIMAGHAIFDLAVDYVPILLLVGIGLLAAFGPLGAIPKTPSPNPKPTTPRQAADA